MQRDGPAARMITRYSGGNFVQIWCFVVADYALARTRPCPISHE